MHELDSLNADEQFDIIMSQCYNVTVLLFLGAPIQWPPPDKEPLGSFFDTI